MAHSVILALLAQLSLIVQSSFCSAWAQESPDLRPEPLPKDVVVCLGSRQWKHSYEVQSVAMSRDGRLALSGSTDHTMALWDVKTGNRLRTFRDHPAGVSAVAFTSDGKHAVSASWTVMALWDVATGERVKVYECTDRNDEVMAMVISPDDHVILWGTLRGTLATTDLNTGKRLQTFIESMARVSCVTFSGDGKLALSGTYDSHEPGDNPVHLWDVAAGTQLRSFKGHKWEVTRVLFTADNLCALSSSADYSITLWNVKTGEPLRKLAVPESVGSPSKGLALSPDGKLVLGCDNDGHLLIREFDTGKVLKSIDSGYVTDVAFSPDGRHAIAGRSRDPIGLYDLEKGTLVHPPVPHTSGVSSAAFSPDGTRVLTASHDKTMGLWDSNSGELIRRFVGHSEGIATAEFDRSGRTAISGSADGTWILWDTESGRMLRQPQVTLGQGVSCVGVFPDGRRALTGSSGAITLWNLESGEHIADLERTLIQGGRPGKARPTEIARPVAIAISPDGSLAVSGSMDELAVWDTEKKTKLRTILGPGIGVTSVAFSPDGGRVVAGTKDKLIFILNPKTGTTLQKLDDDSEWVQVAFSPDGSWIASGSSNGTVTLWDADTGKRVRTLSGHLGPIQSVRFSPGGRRLVTASRDSTALVWQPLLEESRLAGDWSRGWNSWSGAQRKESLKLLCDNLASKDYERMSKARERLMALGKPGIAAIVKAYPPEPKVTLSIEQLRRLGELMERMNSDDAAVREKAQNDLETSGAGTLAWIEDTLRESTTLSSEQRRRGEVVRIRLQYRPNVPIVMGDLGRVRSILMLIEEMHVEGVQEALAAYAGGPEESYGAQLARRALSLVGTKR